ncbi:uncharacterized protein LOC133663026 [Entelurus aequoreus]|uniref:uncharacterized protein LOC133663026 n=1 Tax=Entelurus aequoreus TaxID=161455 RepID=UPI002B1D5472|nr:uncharacterized protein LOC133663026 [Entelurus aequoreus]
MVNLMPCRGCSLLLQKTLPQRLSFLSPGFWVQYSGRWRDGCRRLSGTPHPQLDVLLVAFLYREPSVQRSCRGLTPRRLLATQVPDALSSCSLSGSGGLPFTLTLGSLWLHAPSAPEARLPIRLLRGCCSPFPSPHVHDFPPPWRPPSFWSTMWFDFMGSPWMWCQTEVLSFHPLHGELSATSKRNQTMANRHRRPSPNYKPGQRVWLSSKDITLSGESRKLAPRFIGPYEVERMITPVTARLKPVESSDLSPPPVSPPAPQQVEPSLSTPFWMLGGEAGGCSF